MRAILRSILGLTVALAVVIGVAPPAPAAPDSVQRARSAAGFIANEQQPNGSIVAFSPIGSTSDAVLSLVVAQRGKVNVNKALGYLVRQVENGNVIGVGLQAKVAMAVIAAGRDPRAFGGANLISAIRTTEQSNGRFGIGTPVFEDALAMLALESAGRAPSPEAVAWLAAAQCDDGGWQFDEPASPGDDAHCVDQAAPASDFNASDTNTSSLAVQALAGAGSLGEASQNPFGFFAAIRDAEFDGWGFTWGFQTTDANSTALVIQAYAADGRAVPSGGLLALKTLQYKNCGAFAFSWVDDGSGGSERDVPNVGATIGGIPGLLQRPMPIAADPVEKAASPPPVCP